MNRAGTLLLVCLLALCCAGCGYHFAGQEQILPGQIKSIAIPIFENATARPFLETGLTNQVRSRFARFNGVELLDDKQAAEGVLKGKILSYVVKPSAFDALDNIIEYKTTMQVEAILQRTGTGQVLWKNRISWNGAFPAAADKNLLDINEQKAIAEIGERTAGEILYRMLEDF